MEKINDENHRVYKIPFDMLVYSIMFTPKTLPEYEWIYTMLIFSSMQKMSIFFNIFQGLFNQLDIRKLWSDSYKSFTATRGWKKGLASYCKADTTFTFYFSIINA